MHLIRGLKATRKESGQVLVFFALWLPVILLFVGFAVDFGFGYLTKLRLAKAADAAALKVMLFYGKGQTSAIAIGQSVFSTNITTNSNLPYVTTPSASISFNTAGAEPVVNVVATAQIKTFFIWLAGIPTLSVSDTSQATRPPVIISLVLDRSGSMVANGGSTALPPAVDAFIVYFIPGTDQIGQVSFSTLATNDVPVTTNFVSPVNSSMSSMAFTGATYAQAGLADAQSQITGVASPPVGTQMVVVFFTDGWANTFNATMNGVSMNVGGDAAAEFVAGQSGIFCMNPTNGSYSTSPYGDTGATSTTMVAKCNGQNWFQATDTGPPDSLPSDAPLDMVNIGYEADYRTVQLANTMRAAGTTVYAIGLGDKINTTYLEELANDPGSPTYNSSEPSGIFENAPTAADLQPAFEAIAAKILSRITH